MAAVTVIIDDDVLQKLREIHAKKIQRTYRNISFSRVVNEILRKGLKNKK